MGTNLSGMPVKSLSLMTTDLPVPVGPTARTCLSLETSLARTLARRTVSMVGTRMSVKLAPSGTWYSSILVSQLTYITRYVIET